MNCYAVIEWLSVDSLISFGSRINATRDKKKQQIVALYLH